MNQASVHRPTAILILPALIGMIGCIAQQVVLAANAEFFTGHDWKGALLVVACILAAADGWYVALAGFVQRQIHWLYQALDFAVFVIFLITPWGGVRLDELGPLAKLAAWTLASYGMIRLARWFSMEMTSDLLHLNHPSAEFTSTRTVASLSTLQARIFSGGTPMLIAIGIAPFSRVESDLSLSGSAIAVFVYSVIGLLLTGQARLAVLQNSWRLAKASVSLSFPHEWLRSNLLLILLLASLTFALPTPALTIPNTLPENTFRPTPIPRVTPSPTPTSTPIPTPALSVRPEPIPPDTSPDSFQKFLEHLLGLIPNNPPTLLAQMAANAPIIFLCLAIGVSLWLFRGVFSKRPNTQTPHLTQADQQYAPPVTSAQPTRLTLRRAFTPRDQIHAYYMGLLTRAHESGLERRPGQTPYEHTARLISALPDSQDALTRLTEAFVEARYSQQNIEAEQVNQARTLWQQIQTRLQIYKKKPSE